MSAHNRMTVKLTSGSVLILALWALFFLGTLALAIGAYVSGALNLAGALKAETTARFAARAGVEAAIAAVCKDTNGWDALTEPWSNDESQFREVALEGGLHTISYAGADEAGQIVMRFGLTDEERKVNLNLADSNLVAAVLIRAGGLSPDQAGETAAAICNYRQQKSGAGRKDEGLTGQSGNDYLLSASNSWAALESPCELRLVPGVTGDLLYRIEPYVTIYGTGYVNVNTADPVVLRCLADAGGQGKPEARESLVRMLMSFRGSGEGGVFSTNSVAAMWSALSRSGKGEGDEENVFRGMQRLIGIQSSCFRGQVTGRVKTRNTDDAAIDFVFDRQRGRKVYWHER